MTKALPLFVALTLCVPQAASALGPAVLPPDASEFGGTTLKGASITVSTPAPVAEATDASEGDEPGAKSGTATPFGVSATPVVAAPAVAAEPMPPPEPEAPPPTNSVVLQGLNKVTGHISKLEGPIGTVLTFDNLEIITRRCWKAPADEQPENAALLEIREIKTGEEPKKLFLGWMFSSSPGLSGLEHPVYDVNIVSCEFHENPEATAEPKDAKPKPKPEKPKTTTKKPKKKTQ